MFHLNSRYIFLNLLLAMLCLFSLSGCRFYLAGIPVCDTRNHVLDGYYDELPPALINRLTDMPDSLFDQKQYFPVFQALELKDGDTILDIGAGMGITMSAAFRHFSRLTWIAEDINSDFMSMIPGWIYESYAAADTFRQGNSFMLVEGKAESVPLPDHFYSKILIQDTYHHFADKPAMLSEVKRLLAPGGRVYIFEKTPDKPKKHGCLYIPLEMLVNEIEHEGFKMVSHTKPRKISFLTFEVAE